MALNIKAIAEILKKANNEYVNRFWGVMKTYKHIHFLQVEEKLNAINTKIENTRRQLNLLEAEKLALTAVLQKKIEMMNTYDKTALDKEIKEIERSSKPSSKTL